MPNWRNHMKKKQNWIQGTVEVRVKLWVHSISYCQGYHLTTTYHLPICHHSMGSVYSNRAWGEVTTPPCMCNQKEMESQSEKKKYVKFIIYFHTSSSPKIQTQHNPQQQFCQNLAASLCNWEIWLRIIVDADMTSPRLNIIWKALNRASIGRIAHDPSNLRAFNHPTYCRSSSNQNIFLPSQRWRLDTGDVTLRHQQQIMWWQSCRRDHFETARNALNAKGFSQHEPWEKLRIFIHGKRWDQKAKLIKIYIN